MMRTPSSNAACASGLVFGSATGAIGWAVAPGAGVLCAQAPSVAASASRMWRPGLLITAHLLDAIQGDPGLARAGREPKLRLLGVLVLGEAAECLADRL